MENYREIDAINYSTLSSLDDDPKSLLYPFEGSKATDLGSCVDVLLFDGEEELDKIASFSNVQEPTATLGKFVTYCYENDILQLWQIEQAVDEKGDDNKFKWWKSTVKPEARKANWDIPEFWNYLSFLIDSKDKLKLDSEAKTAIYDAVNTIKTHEFTKGIFENGQSQVAIVQELEGYTYKCLLDYIKIDEKNKIIYPFDLKTTSKPLNSFEYSVRKYRYDIQSSLYKHLLQKQFPDYTIADFKMVVYSFLNKSVRVFNLKNYYEKAKEGYYHNERYIKGWLQLSEEYVWHTTNELYDHDKAIYESNGEVIL